MKRNKCEFAGKICKDAEVKPLGSGATVISTSMYVDDSYKKDGEWVNQGTWCEMYKIIPAGKDSMVNFYRDTLQKGREVLIDCKIVDGSWENQEGKKMFGNPKFQIMEITPIGKKESNEPKKEEESDLPF